MTKYSISDTKLNENDGALSGESIYQELHRAREHELAQKSQLLKMEDLMCRLREKNQSLLERLEEVTEERDRLKHEVMFLRERSLHYIYDARATAIPEPMEMTGSSLNASSCTVIEDEILEDQLKGEEVASIRRGRLHAPKISFRRKNRRSGVEIEDKVSSQNVREEPMTEAMKLAQMLSEEMSRQEENLGSDDDDASSLAMSLRLSRLHNCGLTHSQHVAAEDEECTQISGFSYYSDIRDIASGPGIRDSLSDSKIRTNLEDVVNRKTSNRALLSGIHSNVRRSRFGRAVASRRSVQSTTHESNFLSTIKGSTKVTQSTLNCPDSENLPREEPEKARRTTSSAA